MKNTFITEPKLPPLEDFNKVLKKIWSNKVLSNNGPYHIEFEQKLCSYLGVKYISLFNNATIALIVAQKILGFKNEIITTPFSFIATAHSIKWNNYKPVFADVDSNSGNLDPKSVEKLISNKTSGILAVHNYGFPGDILTLEKMSKQFNLPLLYDSAPAFGVKIDNKSILNYGDLSILSFHATKVFTTFEGGAIISKTLEMKEKIDQIKNFSIKNAYEVSDVGINGKMNELQAAMGILQLKLIDDNIKKRKIIYNLYETELNSISNIRFIKYDNSLKYNFAYCAIFFNNMKNRNMIDNLLRKNKIFCRRYWYPLITKHNSYKNCKKDDLINAEKLSKTVLCLPIYPDLKLSKVYKIIKLIKSKL